MADDADDAPRKSRRVAVDELEEKESQTASSDRVWVPEPSSAAESEVPRYVRVLRAEAAEKDETCTLGERLGWITRFDVRQINVMPGTTLSHAPCHMRGDVMGQDAASLYVVEALDPRPGETVLDMCAAPGTKTLAIADLMQRKGKLIAVDVSEERLNIAVSLFRKHRLGDAAPSDEADAEPSASSTACAPSDEATWKIATILTDGTTFDPSKTKPEEIKWSTGMHRVFFADEGRTGAPRRRAGKQLRKEMNLARDKELWISDEVTQFDRVLVDAQCTHDASVHHEGRVFQTPKREAPALVPERLFALQRDLLLNGYRLLRPGGTLIYSTCSAKTEQNEDVVQELLRAHPATARVVPLPRAVPADPSSLKGALRFTPQTSQTSGMFMAKIAKLLL